MCFFLFSRFINSLYRVVLYFFGRYDTKRKKGSQKVSKNFLGRGEVATKRAPLRVRKGVETVEYFDEGSRGIVPCRVQGQRPCDFLSRAAARRNNAHHKQNAVLRYTATVVAPPPYGRNRYHIADRAHRVYLPSKRLPCHCEPLKKAWQSGYKIKQSLTILHKIFTKGENNGIKCVVRKQKNGQFSKNMRKISKKFENN